MEGGREGELIGPHCPFHRELFLSSPFSHINTYTRYPPSLPPSLPPSIPPHHSYQGLCSSRVAAAPAVAPPLPSLNNRKMSA